MEDIGTGPFGAAKIESWIFTQLKNLRAPEYIADELIKAWESRELLVDAKGCVSKFCIVNGFIPSFIRILKLELRSGTPLSWGHFFEIVRDSSGTRKDLIDACLAGATRDGQLHSLAAAALHFFDLDPRWENILKNELNERAQDAKNKRDKIFKDLLIFKSEGMHDEIKSAIKEILALFPDDVEALSLQKTLGDREFEVRLEKLRLQYNKREVFKAEAPEKLSPEFVHALKKMNKNIDPEQSYDLSIGLSEMGFFDLALETLRVSKKSWTIREKLWEIELLLGAMNFAESLQRAQILLNENRAESDVVKACLYFSAKSYYGLGDQEKALTVMQGLMTHDPHYRDSAVLVREWDDHTQ